MDSSVFTVAGMCLLAFELISLCFSFHAIPFELRAIMTTQEYRNSKQCEFCSTKKKSVKFPKRRPNGFYFKYVSMCSWWFKGFILFVLYVCLWLCICLWEFFLPSSYVNLFSKCICSELTFHRSNIFLFHVSSLLS